MLCLLVKKRLFRKTFAQKLHLCPNNRAVFECFDTKYGKITVYTLFSYGKTEKAESALRKAVEFPIYTHTFKVFEDYIEKAAVKKGIEFLMANTGKTVFLNFQNVSLDDLIMLCRYSSKLYIPFDIDKEKRNEIFRLCGTLPVFTNTPVGFDLCIDRNFPLEINLPENLAVICPKEFSPVLFASLLYKENGGFVI